MNKLYYSALTIVAVVIMVVTGSMLYAAEKKFEKSFSVSPGGTLTLKTDAGSIAVIGTPSSNVRVTAEIKGSKRDVDAFEVSAEKSAKGVEVTGRSGKSDWWFFHSTNLEVRFRVEVPHEYNMDLQSSGGDIDVNGVKGKILGETSGGDLIVDSVDGNVDMHTSGGNIRSQKVNGDLRFETSGGDVEVRSITGAVDAITSGGNIRVGDVNGTVSVNTSGGNIAVKLSGTNKGIHAETSGGNIDIAVPKDAGANIDASTSGGEVVCDLPLTTTGKIEESKVRGTINGGGSLIRAHTSGGNIRIRKSE